jgi:hypothetical protein
MVAAWSRFWFEPQATSTLALFRIGFGLVAFLWTLSLIPNLTAFYGSDGIMPRYPQEGPGAWGLLAVSSSHSFLVAVFLVTLMAAAALTLGLYSRIASVLVWLGVMAFQHRNPLVGNSGDEMVGNLALFCALAPSGVALSVDRLRKTPGRFWEFPARAPWALRLVQIQLSVTYLSTVWQKVQGETWRDGTAVSYALRIADVHRVHTPDFITHSVPLSELLTFGTLALEASLGILVWNRVARPWVLAAGVTMHLSIDFSILVGFFSIVMIVGYISFVPAETATRHILALRDRFRRRPKDDARATAQPPPTERVSAPTPEVTEQAVPVQTIRNLLTGGAGADIDDGWIPAPRPGRSPVTEDGPAPSWETLVSERRAPVNGHD